jgi:hypothetical protein
MKNASAPFLPVDGHKIINLFPSMTLGQQEDAGELVKLLLASLNCDYFNEITTETKVCVKCKDKTKIFNVMQGLSLALNGGNSIQNLIKAYFKMGCIEDYKCSSCKESGFVAGYEELTDLPQNPYD